MTRDSIWDLPKSLPRPPVTQEVFDGDDLQADDFVIPDDGPSKPTQPESSKTPLDDLDWLSIDDSPSSSQVVMANSQRDNYWAKNMEHQDEDGPGPIHLPNGNWACSHKCKDKTR
jgi:ATP-dependent DNA helicase HFM1/MER3